VLSPLDRLPAMRKRVQDFLDMGVPEVWIFDPETRTATICSNDPDLNLTKHGTGVLHLHGTPIEIDLEAAFSTLDM
jgi:Uma2 family endonuclease